VSWQEKVVQGVIGGVLVLIGVAAGKAWGNSEGEEDRKKMNAENEELRRQIRSVLETFKAEMAKKNEEIAWLEAVIEQLMKAPPANANQLSERLRLLDLTETQIELVMVRAAPIYGG
jgi:hypothetical protein